MGGLLGGAKGYVGPPLKLLGGGGGGWSPLPPPPLPTPMTYINYHDYPKSGKVWVYDVVIRHSGAYGKP